MNTALEHSNRLMMGKLLVIAVGMLGFGFAMVPMYRQICDALGLSQTRTVGAENTQVDLGRSLTVELLASSAGLPWRFEALERTVRIHPGELVTVRYRVTNDLGRAVNAHAFMNTAPAGAAGWIEKREWFCFPHQTLAAGEVREVPVVVRGRPRAPRELGTISPAFPLLEPAAGQL